MTADREVPAQAAPRHDADLRRFPVRRLAERRRLYRAHRAEVAPWWFASDGKGRFDLLPPRGTCYVAESPLVAVRERLGTVLGGSTTVPASLLDRIVVSTVELPHRLVVANLRSAAAARFGVLRELEVMVPYRVPQSWAHALAAAGHDGIAYGARFTPGRLGAVAVFGDAGLPTRWPPDDHPIAAVGVPGAPLAIRPPLRAQLTVIPTPKRTLPT